MAGLMSKNIQEDFLTCKICFEPFTNPKVLTCMHSFCLKCLEDTFEKAPRSKDVPPDQIPCPVCREQTQIPKDGMKSLRANFLVIGLEEVVKNEKACQKEQVVHCQYCLEDGVTEPAFGKCVDCDEFMCERCAKYHTRAKYFRDHEVFNLEELKSDRVQKVARSRRRVFCVIHPKEEVKFFCKAETCKQTICRDCRMLDHFHHECIQLETAAESFQNEIQDDLNLLKSKSDEFERVIGEAAELQNVSTDHIDTLKGEIQKRANTLHELTSSEENRLIKDIEKTLEQNTKQLEHFKEGLNITKSSIDSAIQFTEHLFEFGNTAEIASMKLQTQQRLGELRKVQVEKPPVLQKLAFNKGEKPMESLEMAFGGLLPDESESSNYTPTSSVVDDSIDDLANTKRHLERILKDAILKLQRITNPSEHNASPSERTWVLLEGVANPLGRITDSSENDSDPNLPDNLKALINSQIDTIQKASDEKDKELEKLKELIEAIKKTNEEKDNMNETLKKEVTTTKNKIAQLNEQIVQLKKEMQEAQYPKFQKAVSPWFGQPRWRPPED